MSLPKFEYPEYTLKLPSTGQEIKYRPFIVKEQKNLMTALELKNEDAIINALTGIVKACTFNKLDIDKLPAIDIEYIFLQLKAKSSSDILPLTYICENEIETNVEHKTINTETNEEQIEITTELKPCGNKIRGSINLLNVEVERPNVSHVIKINATSGVKLNFPSFGIFKANTKLFDENTLNFNSLIFDCVDYIYNGDEILKPNEDFTKEECLEFLDNLTPDILEEIIEFFNKIPKLKYSINLKCNKCNHFEVVPLEGIYDFLA